MKRLLGQHASALDKQAVFVALAVGARRVARAAAGRAEDLGWAAPAWAAAAAARLGAGGSVLSSTAAQARGVAGQSAPAGHFSPRVPRMVPAPPLAATGRAAGDACGRGGRRECAGAAAAEQVHAHAAACRLGRGAPAWGLRGRGQRCAAGGTGLQGWAREPQGDGGGACAGARAEHGGEPAVEHGHLHVAAWWVAHAPVSGLDPAESAVPRAPHPGAPRSDSRRVTAVGARRRAGRAPRTAQRRWRGWRRAARRRSCRSCTRSSPASTSRAWAWLRPPSARLSSACSSVRFPGTPAAPFGSGALLRSRRACSKCHPA